MTRLFATLLVALGSTLAAPSIAQEKQFEITPFAGYQFGGRYDYVEPGFGLTEMRVEPSATYGVTLDIPVTRSLQVELLFAQQDTELDLPGYGDLVIDEAQFQLYHAGVLWQWGPGQIQPFVVATLGLSRVDPGLTRLGSEEFFSLSTGGGIKLRVARHLGFRFEGRLFFTDVGGYDSYDSCCCCGGRSSSGDLLQGQASAGLILSF